MPAFRLVTFVTVACYVELLVTKGYGLTSAMIAAALVAIGARVAA